MDWASVLKVDKPKNVLERDEVTSFAPTPKRRESPYSAEDQARQMEPTPEMATGRKKKKKEPKLMQYSILIGKILDEYSDKRELTKSIYEKINRKTGGINEING